MDLSKYSEWKEIYDVAESNMIKNSLASNRDGLLIEVAAQHPLKDGVFPDIEFKLRLDLGIRLYNKHKDLGNRVKIYVPGSLHKGDKIALGDAGRNYLLRNGIDIKDILATEITEELSEGKGVYGSTEECICSPPQVMRKVLSYISFGVLPEVHTVDCYSKFHNYIDELFLNIPIVIDGGSSLEKELERLREERKVK